MKMDFSRKSGPKKSAQTRPSCTLVKSIVSSNSSDEFPLGSQELQVKKKLTLIRACSSGFGSINSEDYVIEKFDSPTHNVGGGYEASSSKRSPPVQSSVYSAKKIKVNEENNTSSEKPHILDAELNNKSLIYKSEDPTIQSDFDAFACFLSKESNRDNSTNNTAISASNNSQDNDDDDLFSQSFNTQMINQIDAAISEDESLNKSAIEEEQVKTLTLEKTIKNTTQNFKMPILRSFADKVSAIQEKKNHDVDRSLIFTDDCVTDIYKREVDELFEQIEQSICEMGDGHKSKTIADEILDVFFADDPSKSIVDLNQSKIQEELNKSQNGRRPKEDSFYESNCSLGSVIKQALRNNAAKSFQPIDKDSQASNITLNRSLRENTTEFKSLGNFYGLPNKVKDLIKIYKGIEKLYDWQDECLKLALARKSNLIYALPTSGGKTLVAEILMLREILCRQKNVIFILPYVAIVQEKVWDFSPFGVALDFLVEEYASSKGSYPPRKRRRKRSVYIATIEKALGLVNSLIETGRLDEIGLVVVDELHLIGEEGRGATLESCLTKMIFLNANLHIIGMSATIGNINEVAKFLKAEVYSHDFRPVELTEYVKCENQIAKVNWNYTNENDLLVDIKKVDFKYSEAVFKVDPDMLGGLVLQVVPKESCLVFCASRANCENVVHLLCKLTKPHLKLHKKAEKDQLLHALESEAGELCHILRLSVPFGIAYHHSGLTSEERRLLEEAFRSGTISVICCTSTLAAGVNLPARRVILRSPYIGREFLNLSRYKQMVGRAGRAGLGETGESIIVTSLVDLPRVKDLLMSPMNQAISSLHRDEGRDLRQLLLSCISLGIANTRTQLHEVAQSSLMAVQVDKLGVDIKRLTDSVIKKLFKLGALQESSAKGNERSVQSQCNVTVKMDQTFECLSDTLDLVSQVVNTKKTIVLTSNTKLIVSSLGTAASKGGLHLTRAHQLYNDLYQAQKSLVLLNCLHLLYLVTPYDTSEQIRPNIEVYYDVLTHLNERELQTSRILGFDESVTLKMATGQIPKQIPEKILNRFYVTLMLYDLWNEMPVFRVSEKYQINRGIVQNLMTNSATFASNVVNFCEQLEEFWAFSHLLKGMSQRLSHCCIKELAQLMELPAVKQSRAKQLYVAGYKNLQSIAKANINELMENIEFMSRKVAGQLIAASKMLLLEKVENLREQAEDVLDGVEDPRILLNASALSVK
ncbi:helicase POLQ-like [Euwallacea fornicatus]|uniref:helicase POLQ-like n=1 Tax=Euwallacea fornicatus TaxID=995702 RepID=UPI00338FEF27